MEIWISLEAENGEMCPNALTSTLFSEYLDEYERHVGNLKDVIRPLVERLGLNIEPLLRQAGWEFSRLEFPSDKIFAEYQKAREVAWQPPQQLIDCLTQIIKVIDAHPEIFIEIGLSSYSIEENYFIRGAFRRDLLDLLQMTEWAKGIDAQRILLISGEG